MSTGANEATALERPSHRTCAAEATLSRAVRPARPLSPPPTATSLRFSPADPPARVVFLHGELDADNAPELEDAVEGLLGPGPGALVFDLSDVTFLDCSIVGYLARLRSRFGRSGKTLTVCNPTPTVRRTLEVTGMLDVLA